MEADPDIQLMLRLRAGEEGALNDLMARWQHPVVSFILRYIGNVDDAMDLAQETFVRVFEGRAQYEPRSKFSTWLFTIATNLCRNLARWRERHPATSLDGSDNPDGVGRRETVAAETDTPFDNAVRDDLANAVRQHIQELPHPLKAVILLFEYQDLGYEQIAAIVGCSPKAVETRLYQARRLLRERLEKWMK